MCLNIFVRFFSVVVVVVVVFFNVIYHHRTSWNLEARREKRKE